MSQGIDISGALGKKLNEDERSALVNALRVAAEKFDSNAAQLSTGEVKYPQLRSEFRKQARDARDMARLIEDARWVTIGPPHTEDN